MRNLDSIVRESVESELIQARKAVNTNPTPAQIEIGNYAKGHVKILGFNITIENPKGSYRKGKDRNGKEWKTLMHNDYGYFVRTLGKDGDAIDVFIGPNLKSEKIFPIDQYVNGEFDETKVMLGFNSKEEAKKAYLSNYEKDWKGFKYITEVDLEEFKKWLYDGKKQRKPFAKYKTLNEECESLYDAYENYTEADLLWEFLDNKRNGISKKQWNLIPAQQYHMLLKRYMENPIMARIPKNVVQNWFENIIIPNSVAIEHITNFAGHSRYFPSDDLEVVFGEYLNYEDGSELLEKEGFYDWCSLPDGSDGWSDYGLQPIFKIINSYNESMEAGEILILINRVLDVAHCRGDLASAFIEGGSKSCDYISNSLNESMVLNEKFNSPKLAKMAKEHGGLSVRRNGGLRDGVRAYHGGSKIDPAKVTDDMLQGEPYKYDWQNSTESEYNNSIHFSDGYAVMLKPYDHKRDNNITVPAQRKKPSRYYTGVGDTGDHDKSRGGFVGNGKDNVSAPYNGFSVSDRAGEAQHYREAMKNNRNDINYIQNHKEYYKDWPEKIRNANKNIDTIKGYTKELLNKPKTINESQLRQIIRESIEEFYKGSQNEKAAYENACDCLYYGYGFKFWFERNSHLLNNDSVLAKEIWRQAIDDMANR